MINLRYHIVSLVAVFVALGVGIFIGSTVVGSEGLIMHQQELIDQLEKDFHQLRMTNKKLALEEEQLRNELEREALFNANVLAVLSREMLAGRSIQVIFLSSREETSDELLAFQEFLVEAGSDLELFINHGKYLSKNPTIFFLGEEPPQTIAKYFDKVSQPAAVVATKGTAGELLMECKKAGISTVDNIDTVPGKLALLSILLGQRGSFGTGETAEYFLPDLTEVF